MSARDRAYHALSSFPPLLVELIRTDAPASQISAEGFSDYERDAVTVLVKLAGTASPVPASDPRRSPLEVTTPAPT